MKLKDIFKIQSKTITPHCDTKYHLYSLPAFDNNQTREDVIGSEILSNKFSVPNKCILFNKLNVRFKRVWIVNNSDSNKLASTEFLPLIVNEGVSDFLYAYYLLVSDNITDYLCGQNSNTSQSHKRIDPDFLLAMEVELPPLSQQKIIGEILHNIDSKIALNREINRNLEALARQLYDYWFVQFDFPDENGRPYKSSGGKMVWNEKLKREIPEGWNVEEIGTILGKIKGSIRLQTDEYMSNGKYPIIDQTTGVYYAGFTDNEDAVVQESTVVVFGDHSCAVKYVNFPFVRGADGTQILKSNDNRISEEYLYFTVKDVKFNKGYARHFSILKSSFIIIPNLQISLNFKQPIQRLFNVITGNRQQIIELTKQRDELLPLLMNGQVNCDLSLD